jgi:hypothetical protein
VKHRAVHILVFNARGQVFLQKRSLKKDLHPGVWDSSTSGHLDTGEDYDAVRGARIARGDRPAPDAAAGSGFSKLTRARKPAGNSAGFTAAKARGRSCCIPRKSRRVTWFAPDAVTQVGERPAAGFRERPLC